MYTGEENSTAARGRLLEAEDYRAEEGTFSANLDSEEQSSDRSIGDPV